MSLETIRGAIVARLGAVAGIGAVHGFERYAVKQSDFKGLYESDGRVLGWFVRRISSAEREDTSIYNKVIHRWRIEGLMSLDDAAQSEIIFDSLIEAARAAFRADETLGGTVETTVVDGQTGLQLDDSGPAMFAGVLCHHARLSLATVGSIETGADSLDDFTTFHVDWDLPPLAAVTLPLPVPAPDAEDTITLETA